MHAIQRLMPTLLVKNLPACKDFYTSLFSLTPAFDSDWFVQLVDEKAQIEIGLMQQDHELVPTYYQRAPVGCMMTFVVEDVSPLFQLAQQKGYTLVQEPHDTFYGQKRLLLADPEGTQVDISAPIPDFSFS